MRPGENDLDQYHHDALHVAWTVLRNQPDAEDAVQAALLSVSRVRAGGTTIGNLQCYFLKAVRRKALDAQRDPDNSRREPGEPDDFLSSGLGPEALYYRGEQLRLVLRHIVRLRPVYQDVLRLTLEGKSDTEIGEALGIARRTVAVDRLRAVREIREFLGIQAKQAS